MPPVFYVSHGPEAESLSYMVDHLKNSPDFKSLFVSALEEDAGFFHAWEILGSLYLDSDCETLRKQLLQYDYVQKSEKELGPRLHCLRCILRILKDNNTRVNLCILDPD